MKIQPINNEIIILPSEAEIQTKPKALSAIKAPRKDSEIRMGTVAYADGESLVVPGNTVAYLWMRCPTVVIDDVVHHVVPSNQVKFIIS